MPSHSIRRVIEAADEAISAEDFDALMDFYAEDAILVVRPGGVARGKAEIRRAFVAIAEHFGHRLKVGQGGMVVLEGGGDTALVIMETVLDFPGPDGAPATATREATYVFRRDAAGQWLCVIDNSYGTGLLGGG